MPIFERNTVTMPVFRQMAGLREQARVDQDLRHASSRLATRALPGGGEALDVVDRW